MQCCPKQNPGLYQNISLKNFLFQAFGATYLSFYRSYCMDLNFVNCSFCRFSPKIHSTKHYAEATSTVFKISYVFPHKYLPNTGLPSDRATTLGLNWRGFVPRSHQSNQLVENWESQVKSYICNTEIVKDNKQIFQGLFADWVCGFYCILNQKLWEAFHTKHLNSTP